MITLLLHENVKRLDTMQITETDKPDRLHTRSLIPTSKQCVL